MISITYDFSDAVKMLDTIGRQAPFAAATALTKTAQDVQEAVRKEMPRNFTIRRPWVVQGIRVKAATKTRLVAEVYSRDPFMALQETGGIKRSIGRRVFEWGEYLAVPLDARRSKSDVVNKKDWPQSLVNPFVLRARDGREYLAVKAITTGRANTVRSVKTLRGKQRRVTGNKLMYRLIRQTTLRPRLHLADIAARVIPERWPINFAAAIDHALATAR